MRVLRPSFSAHVRWGEHGAPLRSCGTRIGFEGKTCGIPHLAKNKQDVGHPAVPFKDGRLCCFVSVRSSPLDQTLECVNRCLIVGLPITSRSPA
jgi:hypothetical protein